MTIYDQSMTKIVKIDGFVKSCLSRFAVFLQIRTCGKFVGSFCCVAFTVKALNVQKVRLGLSRLTRLAIEYKLRRDRDHRSWATIRDILSTHHRLTMEYNVKNQNQIHRNHLRLCSNAEPEHKQIYQRLGLKEIPLPRKLYTAK
jgi:hypothetical protein